VTVTGETLAEFNDAKLTDPFAQAAEMAEKAEARAKEIKAAEAKEPKQEEADPKAELKDDKQEEAEDKEERPKKGKLATRFSELTGKARAAEERAAAAEARLAELEGKKTQQVAEKPAPDPKDFSDFDDYTEALGEWKAEKKLAERAVSDKKAKDEAKAAEVMKAWNERLESAKERYEDFHEIVTSASVEYDKLIQKILIESEYGPDVLYHLSNDDTDAAKFAKMNVDQQIKFIGRLEGKFEALADEAEEEKPVVKVEKAKPKLPSPITPIKAKNVSHDPINSPGEFTGSYAEYKAQRLKQRA
jgi:hypothetical protein